MVPVYRERLEADEERSLGRLDEILGHHDRIFVAPRSLRPARPLYSIVSFDDACFRSVDAYSRLLLTEGFYRSFSAYRYLLIYQPDCLVFSDQLEQWCRSGFDYVGAPWLVDPEEPERGFSRVGNGGFSLRRVPAFLEVLESERYSELRSVLRDAMTARLPDLAGRGATSAFLKRLNVLRGARRGPRWYARHYTLNEDRFWSDRAMLFHPGFRIAPTEIALGFSFERAPRYSFERAGGRLPFGCHAWNRWDRTFWEGHVPA